MSRNGLLMMLVATAIAVGGALYFMPSGKDGATAAQYTPIATASGVQESSAQEIIWGEVGAPVTIIEYASMTCNHCAAFHTQTFPELKSKYIDTGLVQLRLRPFPLDAYAMSAAMLSSCVAPTQKRGFVDLLFARQQKWISAANIFGALQGLARQAGLSEEDVLACVQDESILESIRAVQTQAVDDLGVQSTPTFFVNGRKVEGHQTFAIFEKNIIPHLPSNPKAQNPKAQNQKAQNQKGRS